MTLLSWYLHRARLVCWTLGKWGRSYSRVCFWKNSRFRPKGWGLQLHSHSGCHHGLESTHCVTGGASATSNLRLGAPEGDVVQRAERFCRSGRGRRVLHLFQGIQHHIRCMLCCTLSLEFSEFIQSSVHCLFNILSNCLWVQWLVVIEACVLPWWRGPSDRWTVDLLERVVPADIGQAAMARPAPPFRTVIIEATVLQQATGLTGQVWGPQVNWGVGKTMWGMERAMAFTGPARTPQWRGWLSSFSLSG